MTISEIELKPELLQGIETDFGTTISSFLWKKVAQNQAWAERNIPVGYIMSFFGSQKDAFAVLIAQPNPIAWQFCNGGAITNPDSPLLGQNVPDLRTRFLKGRSTIGNIGGQNTINISHSHGGATSVVDDRETAVSGDNGSDHQGGFPHSHSISSNWSSSENVIPPHFEIQYFMRIV